MDALTGLLPRAVAVGQGGGRVRAPHRPPGLAPFRAVSRRFAQFSGVGDETRAEVDSVSRRIAQHCAALRRRAIAAAGLVASFQSHISNIRLDLDLDLDLDIDIDTDIDIDGPDNSFVPGHLHQR